MSTIAFVLVFVLLGLGVLALAMLGSRKGKSGRPKESEARRTTRLLLAVFALCVVALGIGVPAAVIAAVHSRDSVPEANISNLTASEKHGRELFGQHCRVCHTLSATNAVAAVGPNLDNLRPPKALVLDAVNKGRARGNGQMAAQLVEGKDADDVASFVAKAVGQPGGG